MKSSDVEFYCYFSYLGPFWFIGMMSDRRNDRKLNFHLNQGLVLFICEAVGGLLGYLIGLLLRLIPYAGVFLCWGLWLAIFGCAFWLSVRGMMTVAADTKDRLPLIGGINLLRKR